MKCWGLYSMDLLNYRCCLCSGWSWPAVLFQFQAQDEQSPLEGQVMDAPVAWIMTSSTLSTFFLIGGMIRSTSEPVGLKQQDHKP